MGEISKLDARFKIQPSLIKRRYLLKNKLNAFLLVYMFMETAYV